MAAIDPEQIALLVTEFNVVRVYAPTEGTDLDWEQALRKFLLGDNWRQLSWEGVDPNPADVTGIVDTWVNAGVTYPLTDFIV